MIPLVDTFIRLAPEVFDTLNRYKIPAGLPAWLGGIDHPIGLLPEYSIDYQYSRLLAYLFVAPVEVLIQEYLIKSSTDEEMQQNDQILLLSDIMLSLEQVNTIDLLDESKWLDKTDLSVSPRCQGEKWSHFQERLLINQKNSGLISVKEVLDTVSNSIAIRDNMKDPNWDPPSVSVRRRLKSRRKHLLGLVPDDFQFDEESDKVGPWAVSKRIDRKIDGMLVQKDSFLESNGLLHLPSFTVTGVRHFCGGPESL
jgi:hypothetical protein